ncbi:MAG: hypothetical protein ACI9MR_004487 [Myxococcota bacterium]
MRPFLQLYAVFIVGGLILSLARATPHPVAPLSPLANGTQVRASSYDQHRNNHPLFAIDGQLGPLQWRPAPTDAAPWIEVVFESGVAVESVSISPRQRQGEVRCYDASGTLLATAEFEVAHRALSCAAAHRVEVRFPAASKPRVGEIVVHTVAAQ